MFVVRVASLVILVCNSARGKNFHKVNAFPQNKNPSVGTQAKQFFGELSLNFKPKNTFWRFVGFEAWAHNAHEGGVEPEASQPRLGNFQNHGSIFWIPIIRTTGFGGILGFPNLPNYNLR